MKKSVQLLFALVIIIQMIKFNISFKIFSLYSPCSFFILLLLYLIFILNNTSKFFLYILVVFIFLLFYLIFILNNTSNFFF